MFKPTHFTKHFRIAATFFLLTIIGCSKNTGNSNPPVVPPVVKDTAFTNPLLSSGPDPWVYQKDTTYYYTQTLGDRVSLFSTSKMSELSKATVTTIWSPPSAGAYSKNIWAPEIHYLQGKWYVYFAADDGTNSNHRMYAIENASANPLTGTWVFKGKVADPSDKWAIDGSAFEYNGQLYFTWSGWVGNEDGRQDIFIAKMKDPWTIDGDRVMISTPTFDWEKFSAITVNEGPEAIKNSNGRLYLTYSANGCWTNEYSLGLLSLKAGGNPLNASDWIKMSAPVFTKKPENGAYGPGHNGFFKSRDGKEDWIIYHANSLENQGCGNQRNPRMQQFTWNADGSPNLGVPVKVNTSIRKPSGE